MKTLLAAVATVVFLTTVIITNKSNFKSTSTRNTSDITNKGGSEKIYILKDVGEAYMDHFGLTDADFDKIAAAGFDVIEGNFDICASDTDVKYFLEMSQKYNLKVIMPAGSGEAEWGYLCDEDYPDQKPVWDRLAVDEFINRWKSYNNVYAWDTSNEAGSVMPNSDKGYYLTLSQLQTAYKDVKSADSQRPVFIRMNGWFFYDYDNDFFRTGNPFGEKVADIVMVNSYSNVDEYFDDFVSTVYERSEKSIHAIDRHVQLTYALGVWEELPLWHVPTENQFHNDMQALGNNNVVGVGFFKYGAVGSEWYLPDHNSIWQMIDNAI
jgi:hypothetical protein